ncbi:Phage major tail protein 2 [Rickettsiales bacterium Ac37b]|nr:Phage major tail protein 2 [Rickettsiales bacterium Ac37b]
MSAQKGALVLLKVLHNKDGNIFETIGGMRTTRFILNNQLVDCTNKMSGAWRELLSNVGISSVTISGTGIFTNSQSEHYIRSYAFSNAIKKYAIYFGSGEILIGNFQITSYERSGNYNEEEHYSLTLESSGEVKFNLASKEVQ